MTRSELDELYREYNKRSHRVPGIFLALLALFIVIAGIHFFPAKYIYPIVFVLLAILIALGFYGDKVARDMDLVCENHPLPRYLTRSVFFKKELYRTGRCKSCGMQLFIFDDEPEKKR